MTIISLVVSVAALLSISLVVGLHTWGAGKGLAVSRLHGVASLYMAKLRNRIQSAVTDSTYIISRDVVTTALESHYASNISIATENQLSQDLSTYVRSFVTSSHGYRALIITDRQESQIYNLVLSDDTASLSSVLASLEVLSPLLQDGFSFNWFDNSSAILTAPVLTEPPKGTPFYSLSLTVPISKTNPVSIGLQGYASFVFDANKLINTVTNDTNFLETGNLDVVILTERNGERGFKYAASNSDADTSLTNNFYHFSDFPAIGYMADKNVSEGQIITDAWMKTNSLIRKDASVGCSRMILHGVDWVLCAETAQEQALSSVYSLRNKVIGLSFGMLGFISLMVIPTGRIMTAPLYSIYEQMEMPNSKNRNKQTDNNADRNKRSRRKQILCELLWLVGIGSLSIKPTPEREDPKQPDSGHFEVPTKIEPLNRKFYCDELDRLVDEYNGLIDELNDQYHYLEDQVKERTMEAQDARLEAEKANAAKSQFIANITHELRTPLNGIMGMTSVTLSEESIPKIQVALGIILKSGRTLMKLLNELLAFSRSQIDMEPKLSEFSPTEIFANLQNMFNARPEIDRKDTPLKFVHWCDPTSLSDIQFCGDGHRISQICLHLMSNAIKFSSSGDSVTAIIRYTNEQSPRVNVAPYANLSYPPVDSGTVGTLEIAIIDSGRGIEESHLTTLFEPFVQGDDAFSKKYGGTGLGMSMCKQLAGTIGASLGVWSLVGRGTCCVLEVPVVAPKEAPTSPLADITRSPLFQINRNGMFHTASTSSGQVAKFVQDARSPKRMSNMSGEESLYGSAASNSQRTNSNPSLAAPVRSSTDGALHLHHQKKQSAVSSMFSGFLRGPHESRSSLRVGARHHDRGVSSSTAGSYSTAADQTSSVPPVVGGSSTSPVNSVPNSAGGAVQPRTSTPGPRPVSDLTRELSPTSSFTDFAAVEVGEEERAKFLETDHPDYKVLVADDNNLNLEIMVKMLKRAGISDVHTATDGEAVVDLIEQSITQGFHYSVIFMDLSMPRLNGFQATHILRRTLGYPYPIVALTGYSDQRTKQLCSSSNIQEILVKPVLRDALVSVLVKYDANGTPSSQNDLALTVTEA